MTNTLEILTDDLNAEVYRYTTQLGYRLDMIVPADAPRAVLLSKDGERIRLSMHGRFADVEPSAAASPLSAAPGDWITGRAGMEYRDLIPGRLDGKIIASQIRLTSGGEVPDYVHYHKVGFQMIYCRRGRIRVIYEDQGPPFWLETGDCVLQPPKIRHRVLECTAGAEVIEIGMPAIHETWVEHQITLPTPDVRADRTFGNQRFVRSVAADAVWEIDRDGVEIRDLGLADATGGLVSAAISRGSDRSGVPTAVETASGFELCIRAGKDQWLTADIRKSISP